MEDDRGGYRQINKTLNICAFDEYLKGQTAKLPVIADVEQLTPRVMRILGQNPGKVSNPLEIWLLPTNVVDRARSSRSKAPTRTSWAPGKLVS